VLARSTVSACCVSVHRTSFVRRRTCDQLPPVASALPHECSILGDCQGGPQPSVRRSVAFVRHPRPCAHDVDDMRRDLSVPELGRTGKAEDDTYAQR